MKKIGLLELEMKYFSLYIQYLVNNNQKDKAIEEIKKGLKLS